MPDPTANLLQRAAQGPDVWGWGLAALATAGLLAGSVALAARMAPPDGAADRSPSQYLQLEALPAPEPAVASEAAPLSVDQPETTPPDPRPPEQPDTAPPQQTAPQAARAPLTLPKSEPTAQPTQPNPMQTKAELPAPDMAPAPVEPPPLPPVPEAPTPEPVTPEPPKVEPAPEPAAPKPDPAPTKPEEVKKPDPPAKPTPTKPAPAKPAPAKPAPEKPTPAQRAANASAPSPQSAAAATPKAGKSALVAYQRAVLKKIARTKRKAASGKGVAVVGFTVTADGGLAGVVVLKSSGQPAMDAIALDHIRRAAPFPQAPDQAAHKFSFEFVVKG